MRRTTLDIAIEYRKKSEAEARNKAFKLYAQSIQEKQLTKAKPPKKAELGASIKDQQKKYKNLVWRLTEAQPMLHTIPNYHLREWQKYGLDHIISIWEGFRRGLPAEAIASISNLRIISHEDNSIKHCRSDYKENPLSGLLIPVNDTWVGPQSKMGKYLAKKKAISSGGK